MNNAFHIQIVHWLMCHKEECLQRLILYFWGNSISQIITSELEAMLPRSSKNITSPHVRSPPNITHFWRTRNWCDGFSGRAWTASIYKTVKCIHSSLQQKKEICRSKNSSFFLHFFFIELVISLIEGKIAAYKMSVYVFYKKEPSSVLAQCTHQKIYKLFDSISLNRWTSDENQTYIPIYGRQRYIYLHNIILLSYWAKHSDLFNI